eukprot:3203141-Amphidinium_carterae.1
MTTNQAAQQFLCSREVLPESKRIDQDAKKSSSMLDLKMSEFSTQSCVPKLLNITGGSAMSSLLARDSKDIQRSDAAHDLTGAAREGGLNLSLKL